MNTQVNNKCYGCTACVNHCPHHAIYMAADKEGFPRAFINENICTNCGLCQKICLRHTNLLKRNVAESKCFFGWCVDNELRAASASGGAFSLLASRVLEKGGVVFGAAFSGRKVAHRLVENMDELGALRGSKYVQSDLGTAYVEAKVLLDQGRNVLFSGTPCQISGLYLSLGKQYQNLLTVDLLCNSVGSPSALKAYLDEIVPPEVSSPTISFRDRIGGSASFNFTVRDGERVAVLQSKDESRYTKGYLQTLFNRPECSHCPLARPKRVGDISLGDFWGLPAYRPEIHEQVGNQGVSLVFVNNDTGYALFSEIKRQFAFLESVPLKAAGHGMTFYTPKPQHPGRSFFFEHLEKLPFSELVDSALKQTQHHVGLLNLNYGMGYGQVLMNFALSKVLEEMGYTSEVINYIPPQHDFMVEAKGYEEFRAKYLNRNSKRSTPGELESLLPRFTTILAGSDQIWRLHKDYLYYCYWVHGDKRLIAYAASFGFDDFSRIGASPAIAGRLIQRFDAVSVREASGVNICRSIAGIEAEHVLDPTLLIDADDYRYIVRNETVMPLPEHYVAAYFLERPRHIEFMHSTLRAELDGQYDILDLRGDIKTDPVLVHDWLNAMDKADIVLTDSFHCVVFSIIFRKKFIFISREHEGNERIFSLFNMFSINKERFKTNFDFCLDQLLDDIDYSIIEDKILEKRHQSIKFLREALHKEYTKKQPMNARSLLEINYFEEFNKLKNENIQLKALVEILKQKVKILQ